MSDESSVQQNSVTVEELLKAPSLGLDLEVLEGSRGIGNQIRSPRIQKLGLALAGFSAYLHPNRVQVLGGSEVNYLRMLDPGARANAFLRLEGKRICCIILTRGLEAPEGLLELSRKEEIPVLRSRAMSSIAISRITHYLEERLAPRATIHGVLVEVFGLGILLLGPSGIGKSECALELVLKGHRLIADDAIEVTRHGVDRLVGSAGPVLRHHMELRGMGIIDIQELFGISATSVSRQLDFAVRMERWKPDAEYDRLGAEPSSIEFLGVSIPIVEMPVAPGRNVATLVEVAARLHMLRQRRHQPSSCNGPGSQQQNANDLERFL